MNTCTEPHGQPIWTHKETPRRANVSPSHATSPFWGAALRVGAFPAAERAPTHGQKIRTAGRSCTRTCAQGQANTHRTRARAQVPGVPRKPPAARPYLCTGPSFRGRSMTPFPRTEGCTRPSYQKKCRASKSRVSLLPLSGAQRPTRGANHSSFVPADGQTSMPSRGRKKYLNSPVKSEHFAYEHIR